MKNKIKVYTFSTICLTVLLAALRTAALLTAYDSAVGYFDSSPLPTLTASLTTVSAIWCFSSLFLIPRSTISCTRSAHPFCLTADFAAAAVFFVCGLSISIGASGLTLAAGLLMLASSLYFISEMAEHDWVKRTRGRLGFLPISCLVATLFDIYFDMFVPINSPHKNALQLSILASLFFLLCEVRIHIGKCAPRAALCSRLLCMLTAFPTAVGNLIFYYTPTHDRFAENAITPLYALPLLTLSLYAASRLFLFCSSEKKEN